ncbi:MAG: hypothetical protein WC274_09995 [Sulfurimonas sp.]|jgi:hypothetical protein
MSDPTRLYIWRSRERGVLVVLAKSVEDAREVVAEKAPTWERYARTHEPEATKMARSGELVQLRQR